ncbi:MAG: aminotransferase class I/II-fold pyridoxal phosphate-dependent enzyme, partial [Nitrospinales bacterium]
EGLAKILREKTSRMGRAIYLISDDPYKKIVFDGVETPNVMEFYENSIYITSHSKDLAVPGERIGFAALHPRCEDARGIMEGLVFCNRVLGFVNAPALIQRTVKNLQNARVDAERYRRTRDFLYGELTRIGYQLVKPQGAFYMFPRSPMEDEVEFCRILAGKKVLVVPGRGFGSPGFFRLAYCVPDEVVERSIPGFEAAYHEAKKAS